MKPKAVVVSEFDSKNLGDQAIYRALGDILEPSFKVEAVLLSYHGEAKVHSGVANNAIHTARRFSRLLSPKLKARLRWYCGRDRTVFKAKLQDLLRDTDLVIVGGGQLIKNNISLFSDRLRTLERVARHEHVPCIMVGVGVDSKMDALTRWLVRPILEYCDTIFFRDRISEARGRRIARKITCETLPDLAFALDVSKYVAASERSTTTIAINVMSPAVATSGLKTTRLIAGEFSDSYRALIAKCHATGRTPVLFTSGSEEDHREAIALRHEMKKRYGIEVQVFHPDSVDDLLFFLGSVRDVFAARMHVGILSYVCGGNPICLNWDDKVDGVWSAVNEKQRTIELSELHKAEFTGILCKKFTEVQKPTDDRLQEIRKAVEAGVRKQIRNSLDTKPAS